jgi:hypothetical protein
MNNLSPWQSRPLGPPVFLALFVLLAIGAGHFFESTTDWHGTFYPAAQEVWHGRSPFNVTTFLSVPWTIVPMLPLALLPERAGSAALFLASLLTYIFVAHRLGARGAWIAVFLAAPPVIHSLLIGNIDCLSLLGFVLPPQVGLFFVLMKPQIGLAMALYWLVEAWRQGGPRQVVRVFAPVVLLLGLSLLVFGNWTATRTVDPVDSYWNTSRWPWSIPIGLVLVALSLRDSRQDFAMAATPFLSPYVAYNSWVGVVAALVPRKLELSLAVLGMWIEAVVRAIQVTG